jgi:hypothetical protein
MYEKENKELETLEKEKKALYDKIESIEAKQNDIRKGMIKDLINFKNGQFYKYCPFEDEPNRLRTYFYWDEKCTKTFTEKGMELTISNALIVDRGMSSQNLVIESPYKITFLTANHLLDKIFEVPVTEVSDIYTWFHKTLQKSLPSISDNLSNEKEE